jgi:hypothetical protein
VLEALIINAYNYYATSPSNWIFSDNSSWTTGNGIPVDGSVSPMLQAFFTNGSSTNCDFAGVIAGTYDTDLTNALASWKAVASFTKMYIRINQEFNTGTFSAWNAPNFSSVANWVSAWKHWANVMHTWGNSNGVQIRVVWCPDTSYSQQTSYAPSAVTSYFPQPDGSAVNGRYIDVIGCDNYMNGWGVNTNIPTNSPNIFSYTTTPLTSCTVWSYGTYVKMCQTYNCNLAISETGDGPGFDSNNSWTDGSMYNWATYLNTLATLSPAVPIEYIAIYDITGSGATQFSGTLPSPGLANMQAGWRSCLGTAGNGSIPPIMTIAPS